VDPIQYIVSLIKTKVAFSSQSELFENF